MCIYIVYHCLVTMDFYIYIHYLEGRYLYYAKESLFLTFLSVVDSYDHHFISK